MIFNLFCMGFALKTSSLCQPKLEKLFSICIQIRFAFFWFYHDIVNIPKQLVTIKMKKTFVSFYGENTKDIGNLHNAWNQNEEAEEICTMGWLTID